MTDQAAFLAAVAEAPIVPVLTVDAAGYAPDLARALYEGGIRAAEITMRTEAALDVIAAMKKAAPELLVGAGTVLTPADLDAAMKAGADFFVSPGVSKTLVAAILKSGVLFTPGVATASEAMERYEEGFALQKFFPAESNGGVAALKSLGGPLPQIKFMPTGGITADSAKTYLALPNVVCVGGSWMATSTDFANGAWGKITDTCREGLQALRAAG